MCTSLAPRIGYDLAAAVAKAAPRSGRTVREVALEMSGKSPEAVGQALGSDATAVVSKLGVPTREEIERLLEPHGQTVRGTGVGGAAGGWTGTDGRRLVRRRRRSTTCSSPPEPAEHPVAR